MIVVSGNYGIVVAISTYNRCVNRWVTREDLRSAFSTPVLASPIRHGIDSATFRAPHSPRPVHTGASLIWLGQNETNNSSCSDQFCNESPPRVLHSSLPSDFGISVSF